MGGDPQALRPGTHLGLWSMGERVEQLGGRFEMESAPGRGTKLVLTIPHQADVPSGQGLPLPGTREESER